MISDVMAKRIELWRTERLIPYTNNARTHSQHQVAQIARSIAKFGFICPILIDCEGGIVAGHGRFLAAQQLGLDVVPVVIIDHLNEAELRAFAILDNQLALASDWDEERLRAELARLQDEDIQLDLLGFGDEELARLLVAQPADCGLADADALPELPETPVSTLGDFWVLGNHKLLVGDATIQSDVGRLMAGVAADLVIIDPPYNCDYQGYTEHRLKMVGDKMSEENFKEFLGAAFRSCRSVAKSDASSYVFHPSARQREFQDALEAAGFELRCQLIWAKNTFAWGFGRYKFQHEPLFYCHVAGETDRWFGDKCQSTLLEVAKPPANRAHPTSKPVPVIEPLLLNSSKFGDLVVDLFGGSGTTLIACERNGRKARLLEIDPRYADCIVRRWQDYTSSKAVLESSGCSFEQLMQERKLEQSITESNKR